jgi:hypothetical protein
LPLILRTVRNDPMAGGAFQIFCYNISVYSETAKAELMG